LRRHQRASFVTTAGWRGTLSHMSASRSGLVEPVDSPAVAALRKRIRGETLTADEQTLLANATRKPASGPTVPHEEVMRMLAERERRGE
jgi:hypothetical protein